MGILHSRKHVERGPFAALLLALVVFMALVPLVDTLGWDANFLRIGFTVVLIVGLGVAREDRGILSTAVLLLVPNIAMQWAAQFSGVESEDQELWKFALGAGYLFYLAAVLVRTLLRRREACLDAVLGGINIYLILALAFMELHLLLESVLPGSYVTGGVAISDPASLPHGSLSTTLLYFSFTTLTTLGYGDIAPARPIAQFLCSAEAVIGQLFVAILIGGLVALWVGGMKSEPGDSPPPTDLP